MKRLQNKFNIDKIFYLLFYQKRLCVNILQLFLFATGIYCCNSYTMQKESPKVIIKILPVYISFKQSIKEDDIVNQYFCRESYGRFFSVMQQVVGNKTFINSRRIW